jgi:hypothetical protein
MGLLLILLRPHLHDRRSSRGQCQEDPLSVLAAHRNLRLSSEDQIGTRQLIRGRGGSLQEGQ